MLGRSGLGSAAFEGPTSEAASDATSSPAEEEDEEELLSRLDLTSVRACKGGDRQYSESSRIRL